MISSSLILFKYLRIHRNPLYPLFFTPCSSIGCSWFITSSLHVPYRILIPWNSHTNRYGTLNYTNTLQNYRVQFPMEFYIILCLIKTSNEINDCIGTGLGVSYDDPVKYIHRLTSMKNLWLCCDDSRVSGSWVPAISKYAWIITKY
jgi:hypothetical protein